MLNNHNACNMVKTPKKTLILQATKERTPVYTVNIFFEIL